MAETSDWMPGPRTLILEMNRIWIEYLTAARRTAWGVPQEQFTELANLYDAARELLQKAMDKAERTHVITVECRGAFKVLEAKMRFFRDRYFKMPPLTEGDWAVLGFREKDPHPTPTPAPDGVPAAALSYPGGPHAMMLHLGPLAGTQELDPRSDYGYSIYMGIMPPGGATLEQAASDKHYLLKPPAGGKGLQHYRFTRRRKEKIVF
ncbi:MAG: hypothetical protein LBO80_03320, partial [Treponema sp.]|nr:hypothetical protein [Treponema sp.]